MLSDNEENPPSPWCSHSMKSELCKEKRFFFFFNKSALTEHAHRASHPAFSCLLSSVCTGYMYACTEDIKKKKIRQASLLKPPYSQTSTIGEWGERNSSWSQSKGSSSLSMPREKKSSCSKPHPEYRQVLILRQKAPESTPLMSHKSWEPVLTASA